jgi:Tol biopolymer transport system component
MPTGPGELRMLDTGNLVGFDQVAAWMPDLSRVVFDASEPGRPLRVFVQSVAGGPPRPVTPEGVQTARIVVSPDSTHVIARVGIGAIMRYPIDGGNPLPIAGLLNGDMPVRFSRDGQSIWVLRRADTPPAIWQIDLASGRRTLWQEIAITDPAGFDLNWLRVELSDDGKSYVYGYMRQLSDLYLAGGLK